MKPNVHPKRYFDQKLDDWGTRRIPKLFPPDYDTSHSCRKEQQDAFSAENTRGSRALNQGSKAFDRSSINDPLETESCDDRIGHDHRRHKDKSCKGPKLEDDEYSEMLARAKESSFHCEESTHQLSIRRCGRPKQRRQHDEKRRKQETATQSDSWDDRKPNPFQKTRTLYRVYDDEAKGLGKCNAILSPIHILTSL